MDIKKNLPVMPKATAVWLVENTSLTFKQISEFCGMHELEIKGIADGEVCQGIMGVSPITNGQLTKAELERCTQNPNAKITMANGSLQHLVNKKSNSRYTPIARRQDKPDAIYWLIKACPNIQDTQIIKLIGTTKSTILAIKERSHWNMKNIKARDPVLLGLCTQSELDKIVQKYSNIESIQEDK
jgi:uncharacterized protein